MHLWEDEKRPHVCWRPGTLGNEYSAVASGHLTSSPTAQQLEDFHWCPWLSHDLEGQHDRVIFPWVLQIPITSAEPGTSTYLDAEFLRFYKDDTRGIVSWNVFKNATLMNLQLDLRLLYQYQVWEKQYCNKKALSGCSKSELLLKADEGTTQQHVGACSQWLRREGPIVCFLQHLETSDR